MISAVRGGSEESDFTMALPGGGSLHAHRRVRPLPDGLTWIEEEMEVDGRLSGPFATGPSWIFELHTVAAGEVTYMQDGVRLPIGGARFGILYAPYSVTDMQFDNVKTRWIGVAGQSDAGSESLVFDISPEARPTGPDELLAMLGPLQEARSVERCTRPSPLIRRAKAALEASYHSSPTIASVARGLGVSHSHLTREFKRELGMTPKAYRHALRASEAAGRLSHGERIARVSGEVGYEDLGRFYKSFRKALHTTPGDCRIPEIASRSAKTGR